MSDQPLAENITNILSIARLAPSVHNSQPWQVKIADNQLLISLSEQRQLTYGDPTGRQTWISLGIFTEACLISLEARGFKVENVQFKKKRVVIATSYENKKSINKSIDREIEALKNRFTDRSIYQKTPITDKQLEALESVWKSQKVKIITTIKQEVVEKCALSTRQGLLLALSSPDFRKELTSHLVPSAKTPFGIPLSTLQTSKIRAAFTKKLISSGLSRTREAELEYKRWLSASALVFILASGDFHDDWLESGRAYLRASLAIQKLGLSQATSAAIVEAADFHEDIEELLGTKMRLQCVLRIGKGRKKPLESGRYSAHDLLVT